MRVWAVRMVSVIKQALSNGLFALAVKLDPGRPAVIVTRTGGLKVMVGGLPIAEITPGVVRDERGSARSW